MRRPTVILSLLLTVVLMAGLLTLAPPTTPAAARLQNTSTQTPSPKDAARHLAEGIRQFTTNFDTSAALGEFNAAVAADPELWDAYVWRARLYYDVGALDLALADLNIVLEQHPDSIELLLLRARVYIGPFRMEAAFSSSLNLDLGYFGFWRQPDLALADIERVAELSRDHPQLPILLGDFAAAQWYANQTAALVTDEPVDQDALDRDYFTALNSYLAISQFYPNYGQALYHAGFLMLHRGDFTQNYDGDQLARAQATLTQAADKLPASPYSAYLAAILLDLDNQPAEALATLQVAVKQFPNYAPLRQWYANFVMSAPIDVGLDAPTRHEIREENTRHAVELAPISTQYQLMRAWVFFGEPEFIAELETALQLSPGYPPALFHLAVALSQAGTAESCERAIAYHNELLEANLEVYTRELWDATFEEEYALHCTSVALSSTSARLQATATPAPSSIDAATLLAEGILNFTKHFDTPAALAAFDGAIAANPNLNKAYVWRARLYYDVGALHLALADLNTVLERDPDDVEALIMRARVYAGPMRFDTPLPAYGWDTYGYFGYGRYHDLALEDLERAEALAPQNPDLWLAWGDVLAADWYAKDLANPLLRFSDEVYDGAALSEQHDTAISSYEFALVLDPQNIQGIYQRSFFSLVPSAFSPAIEAETIARAQEDLYGITLRAADTPQSAYVKAILHWMSGRPAEAIAELQGAIETFPNYAPLYHSLTLMARNAILIENDDVDFYEMQDLELSSAQQAIELAPQSPRYRLAEALIFELTPDFIPHLEALLATTPGYPPALYHLALGYIRNATTESCAQALIVWEELLEGNLERYVLESWPFYFESTYVPNCTLPTPTPAALSPTNARFTAGDTITLPGIAIYTLNSTPQSHDNAILCTAGTTATVLQTVVVDGVNVVELECDGGVGWMEEILLPQE